MTLSWPTCEKSSSLHADANQQIDGENDAKCQFQGHRPAWLWPADAGVMNFDTQAESIDHHQQIHRIFIQSEALLQGLSPLSSVP